MESVSVPFAISWAFDPIPNSDGTAKIISVPGSISNRSPSPIKISPKIKYGESDLFQIPATALP